MREIDAMRFRFILGEMDECSFETPCYWHAFKNIIAIELQAGSFYWILVRKEKQK